LKNLMQKSALKRFFDHFKRTKLRASSIVEVIVALAICMIIFMISMSVIVNSQRSNNIRLKQKAQFILSVVNGNIQQEDTTFDNGSLRLETTFQKNDTISGVSKVSYLVFDNSSHLLGMKVIWVATDSLSNTGSVIGNNN